MIRTTRSGFRILTFSDRRTDSQLASLQDIEDKRLEVQWRGRVAENVKSRTLADPRYLAQLRDA